MKTIRFIALLLAATLILAACSLNSGGAQTSSAPATRTPAPAQPTAAPAPVAAAPTAAEVPAPVVALRSTKDGAYPAPQPGDPTSAPAAPAVTPIPDVNPVLPAEAPVAEGPLFQIWGVPNQVDPAVVDKSDHGDFKHTIGLGSEMILGEPGKVKFEPGRDLDTRDRAPGTTDTFNPASQGGCNGNPPCYVMAPEGGFTRINWGGGAFHIEGYPAIVNLEFAENHSWSVYVRGPNSDSSPQDLNADLVLTHYKPAHLLWDLYPGVDPQGGGFVSEGQFKQDTDAALAKGTNCGASGCRDGQSALFLDTNTGAWVVLHRPMGGDWEFVASNWATGR